MIERWELLQAQDLSKEMRTKQDQQRWEQLNSDLNKICAWLGEAQDELEQQRKLDGSTDIQTIELRIKKLKVTPSRVQRRSRCRLAASFYKTPVCFTHLVCCSFIHKKQTRQLQIALLFTLHNSPS